MYRWTATTRNGKTRGEANTVEAAKAAARAVCQAAPGGGIITVDDLEGGNTPFHTEAVQGK
jgi:hypothetical protein